MAGGDGEASWAGKQRAEPTLAKMRAGEDTTGLPRLIELLELPDAVTKTFRKWLGIAKAVGTVDDQGFEVDDQGFETDADGRLLKSQRNIRKAVELLDFTLSHDAFRGRSLIKSGNGRGAVIDDPEVDKLWLAIDDRWHLLPSAAFFRTVVEEAARRNTFHPVCDYLDSLTWDGEPRLDRWLVTYCGADDNDYTHAVGAITLIAAVRRVRHPGVKFDEMLVLEGKQGSERSSLIAALPPDPTWFSDDLPLNADGKRVIEQTAGKWIIEAAELSGMRKADVEHLKAMLSRQSDTARLAYGHNPTDRPRQFIPIGTTNNDTYLKDVTGNRRFWPVAAPKVNVSEFKRDRDQIWAEASHREANGASIDLEGIVGNSLDEQQRRTVDDPWQELISDVLKDTKGKLFSADLWRIVDVDPAHRTQDHNTRIGNVMKVIGFERRRLRIDGEPEYCYVRGDKLEQAERIHLYRNDHGQLATSRSPRGDVPPEEEEL